MVDRKKTPRILIQQIRAAIPVDGGIRGSGGKSASGSIGREFEDRAGVPTFEKQITRMIEGEKRAGTGADWNQYRC